MGTLLTPGLEPQSADTHPAEQEAFAALAEWQALLRDSKGGTPQAEGPGTPATHALQDMQLVTSVSEGVRLLGDACSQAVHLPTMTQDRYEYIIIQRLVYELRNAAKAHHVSIDANVALGSLPTGYPDAQTLHIEGSSYYLTAFNSGLFGFLYQLGRMIASVIPYERTAEGVGYTFELNALQDSIDGMRGTLHSRMADLLYSTLYLGNPWASEPFKVKKYLLPVSTALVDSSHAFVVGHEFAHVQAGHLFDADTAQHAIGNRDGELLNYSWQHEFEADFLGLQEAFALCQGRERPTAFTFAGAELYLNGVLLLVRAAASVEPANLLLDPFWPPLSARISALQAGVGFWLDGYDDMLAKEAACAQATAFVMDRIWEGCEGDFRSLVETRGSSRLQLSFPRGDAPVEWKPQSRVTDTYRLLGEGMENAGLRKLIRDIADGLAITLVVDLELDPSAAQQWIKRLAPEVNIAELTYLVSTLDPIARFIGDSRVLIDTERIAQAIRVRYGP